MDTNNAGVIDPGAVMEEVRLLIRYQGFVRAGIKALWCGEWQSGDHGRFFGRDEFVKKVAAPIKPRGATRPTKLEVLVRQA